MADVLRHLSTVLVVFAVAFTGWMCFAPLRLQMHLLAGCALHLSGPGVVGDGALRGKSVRLQGAEFPPVYNSGDTVSIITQMTIGGCSPAPLDRLGHQTDALWPDVLCTS